MPKKTFSAERIVTPLRQFEMPMAQGKLTPVGHAGMPAYRSRATR
jgi:hypothetical protein